MPKVQNVTTGKPKITGAIFRAPIGTPLPTSATEALDAAFLELGYVSEDGVTNNNTATTETTYDWGGTPVLNEQTEKPDEWTYTLIEALNPNVLGTVYGDENVTYNAAAGTIHVRAGATQVPDQVYVIDMRLRGGAMKRTVIPIGSLGEVGEIVYNRTDPVGYPITIKGMDDGTGLTHHEYITLPSGEQYSLTLAPSTASVAVGATVPLTPTTTPAGGLVTWATSDPTKATVDASGVVKGVGAGSCVITAVFGGLAASCAVTVTGG